METTAIPIVNYKTAWWRQHKNDPALKESMKASAKKYYENHRETAKAKALAYYYNVKRVKNQQAREAQQAEGAA